MSVSAQPLAVELTGLVKTFHTGSGVPLIAVDGVSLAVPVGQAVALTGASGSGKSTLLHLIGAIERPEQGTLVVNGQALNGLSRGQLAKYRRTVGFVFQKYNLLPALTALDNVVAPLLPFRVTFDKTERARGLLNDVGLAGREGDVPSKLSGGQQQRVAIARALIGNPTLLLADEPTGNLDSQTGEDILALLLELRRERDVTVVIATHDLSVADSCDRIIKLSDGRIIGDKVSSPLSVNQTPSS